MRILALIAKMVYKIFFFCAKCSC